MGQVRHPHDPDRQRHPVRRATAQPEYRLLAADALRHDLRYQRHRIPVELAATARRQLRELQDEFSSLGELRSLSFHGPDTLGGDEYELHFTKGSRIMALVIGAGGKIVAASRWAPLP